MGRLHARAVARRAEARGDCRLVGVVDRHETRSERVAEEFGAPACPLGEVEADAAIVAGLRREGQLREQVAALEKRRSPVLFYLLFAAACWAVYVRDREGVRWTH